MMSYHQRIQQRILTVCLEPKHQTSITFRQIPTHFHVVHDVLCQCWREWSMLQDMCDAKIITLYKNKGDRSDCNTYVGWLIDWFTPPSTIFHVYGDVTGLQNLALYSAFILTQILTGPHSVASYDMRGNAEDIF
jgi:hypothetical protein